MATTKSTAPAGLKHVYAFGAGSAEGSGDQKDLLGGKGANLAEMARLGLPVPPGFTITTEVCTHYYGNNRSYPSGLQEEVAESLAAIETTLGRKLGDPKNPLTVSVRSGARASMPGMMDTILNLGLNDRTVEGLAQVSGSPRFAWDCYRRFVAMYGDVVLNLKPLDKRERDPFEVILEKKKIAYNVKLDTELSVSALQELVRDFKAEIRYRTGTDVSRRPDRAALGRHRRRVRLVDERARDRLPPAQRDSRELGHGRQRPVDGLRQPRRGLRHGRRVHARPVHGRERLLRRVPHQRAGRGRRRRREDAAEDRDARDEDAEGLRGAPRHPQEARGPLRRHAGHRVHGREAASSGCCRPARASAPASPRCASPSRWSRRSGSRPSRRSCA